MFMLTTLDVATPDSGLLVCSSGDAQDAETRRISKLTKSIARLYPGLTITKVKNTAADVNTALERSNAGGKSQHAKGRPSAAPFILLLAPDTDPLTVEANLAQLVSQAALTDVDILGFHTLDAQPLRRSHVAPKAVRRQTASAPSSRKSRDDEMQDDPDDVGAAMDSIDPIILHDTRHFRLECLDFVHHQWSLRHHRSPFGYQRQERFVEYCHRTSRSFLLRRQRFAGGGEANNPRGTEDDTVANILARTPPPSASTGGTSTTSLFDSAIGAMALTDMFLRLKTANDRLVAAALNATKATLWLNAAESQGGRKVTKESGGHGTLDLWRRILERLAISSPTRLPGYVMVGTCSECLLPVHRNRCYEDFTLAFAERHQVEAYIDEDGRRGPIRCVKSGGIYGHSNRGLYSPLCHRLHRQRDFLFLADLWTDPLGPLRPSGGHNDIGHSGRSSVKETKVFGISLHHGNLFGALRFSEELLWETDGDIDFIAFNATHEELIDRMERLVAEAKKVGFEIKLNYPEKPWYVQFLRDKTDFQINGRSVLDEATRGRPPQRHNVTVWYQGRRVFVNGFQNPWRSVRLDPGHDYRDAYLAQQGWVLHFTKNAVSCKVDGHNACLPDCNQLPWQLDHGRCTPGGGEGRAASSAAGHLPQPVHYSLRNPILLFDAEAVTSGVSSPTFASALPGGGGARRKPGRSPFVSDLSISGSTMDVTSIADNHHHRAVVEATEASSVGATPLEDVAHGEAALWLSRHGGFLL